MASITFKVGEAKTIRFTVTDDGAAVDLSTATLRFLLKESKADTEYLVSKEDGDFGKAQASSGIVTVPLSSTDLTQSVGRYVGELEITFSASNVDRSTDIDVVIEQAVAHD
jgi:hypothetical protein